MQDLFNSDLNKPVLLVIRFLEAAAIVWLAWCVFVKHVGLKRVAIKMAYFVIDLLEPEPPQRKHNIRSTRKPFNKRR